MIAKVDDLRKIRSIALNVADEVFEPYMQDVELNNVVPCIGYALYKEIETNPDDPRFAILLHGGEYGEAGCEKLCRGLIYAIATLSYWRYLLDGDIQVTGAGIVHKTTSGSTMATEQHIVRAANNAKALGDAALHQCVELLKWQDQPQAKMRKTYNKVQVIKL